MQRKENPESTVAVLGAHQLPEKIKKEYWGKKSRNKTATLSRTNIKEQHSRLGTKLERLKNSVSKGKAKQ